MRRKVRLMIQVTKMDRQVIYIAADLIESVEGAPDTSIVMQGGRRFVVLESIEEVVKRVVEYKRAVHAGFAIRNTGNEEALS